MTKPTNPWGLALLWINSAVAIVILVEYVTGRFASAHEFLRAVAVALVYANLAGLFGTWVMSGLVRRATQHGHWLRWLVPAAILAFTAIGGLLAQGVLTALGFASAEHFWHAYVDDLRVAVPLALVFGLGAFAHATLQTRMATMSQQLHEQGQAEARARELAARARLRSLEARLHPHFLFNTLNSIAALIPLNPEHAEQLVGRLAVLLRTSLDAGHRPLIPLREELAMVASYLEIEKARFGDRLHCAVTVQVGGEGHAVPPLAVQSLVENAVKHGVMAHGEGAVFVDATLDDTGLRVQVRDTGPGFDLTAVPAGRGLDNLTERLEALFGDSAGLRVFRRDDQTVVELALP